MVGMGFSIGIRNHYPIGRIWQPAFLALVTSLAPAIGDGWSGCRSPFGRPDSGTVGGVRGAFPDFSEFWRACLVKKPAENSGNNTR